MNISSVTCFEIYLPNEKQLEKLNEIKKKKKYNWEEDHILKFFILIDRCRKDAKKK